MLETQHCNLTLTIEFFFSFKISRTVSTNILIRFHIFIVLWLFVGKKMTRKFKFERDIEQKLNFLFNVNHISVEYSVSIQNEYLM